jgi:hypothetical protein
VTWDEVSAVAESGRARDLLFLADAALERAGAGDLFAPVLSVDQVLPLAAG